MACMGMSEPNSDSEVSEPISDKFMGTDLELERADKGTGTNKDLPWVEGVVALLRLLVLLVLWCLPPVLLLRFCSSCFFNACVKPLRFTLEVEEEEEARRRVGEGDKGRSLAITSELVLRRRSDSAANMGPPKG